MPSRTTSCAPPEVEPGDDPDRLAVALAEGVDGRVGADVGGVERAAEQRLDGCRAGVEDLGRQRGVAQLVGDVALVDADDRRGVGDVGEVAEAQLGRGGRPRTPPPPVPAAVLGGAGSSEPQAARARTATGRRSSGASAQAAAAGVRRCDGHHRHSRCCRSIRSDYSESMATAGRRAVARVSGSRRRAGAAIHPVGRGGARTVRSRSGGAAIGWAGPSSAGEAADRDVRGQRRRATRCGERGALEDAPLGGPQRQPHLLQTRCSRPGSPGSPAGCCARSPAGRRPPGSGRRGSARRGVDGEPVPAVLAAAGVDQAGAAQVAQDRLEEALRDALGLGDLVAGAPGPGSAVSAAASAHAARSA